MKRKAIQVSVVGLEDTLMNGCSYMTVALCNDGTMWRLLGYDSYWHPVPEIPQPVETAPEPYDDCLLTHADGSQRIGRMDRNGDCWRLARYQDCKRGSEVVWSLAEVVQAVPVIRFAGGDQ